MHRNRERFYSITLSARQNRQASVPLHYLVLAFVEWRRPSGCCARPGAAEEKARGRRAACSPASRSSRPVFGGRRLVEVVLVSDAGKIRRNAGAAAPRVF